MNDEERREAIRKLLSNAPVVHVGIFDESYKDSDSNVVKQKIDKTQFREKSLHLLDLEYRKRKIIMTVPFSDKLYDGTESPLLIDIDANLPIDFPMGHPIENHLYVGHPLIPKKYIPFETYQSELVDDRVREFCMLAQSLGATEISIECLNSSNSDRYTNGRTSASAHGGNRVFSGSAEMDYQHSRRMIEELSRSISLRQTYEPCDEPFVPDGLVWYQNEPSWQRLVSQRKNGLLSHEERIETKKCQIIDSKELLNLKANVECLLGKAGVGFSNEDNKKFVQQENAVISIKVKFASL